jgi:hypothetical protein
MTTCTLCATAFGAFVAVSPFLSANAQAVRAPEPTTQTAQSFALTGGSDLIVTGGKAETVEYEGRKAVRLTTQSKEDVFAFLKEIQFQDGTIEADIAMKVTTPPGVRMPGFLGIAFRARTDGSHYDLFYLRPGNSHAEDQAMRNHSVQYVAAPGFDWYKLRREWPWIYESYADLQPEGWNKVKIEVHGRTAKLYVNGSENPSLIVNGLKGEDLHGSVALWGYPGEEAYFSNVKVHPAQAEAVNNGGRASGAWDVKFASDYGSFEGSMNLHGDGEVVTGTWSGAFGQDQEVNLFGKPVATAWSRGLLPASRIRFSVVPWTTVLYSFQPEVTMRVDRVEVTWDKSKSSWLLRITNGEEVIRRYCKVAKDADEQTLRSLVQKALQDEGYEPDPISMDVVRNSL